MFPVLPRPIATQVHASLTRAVAVLTVLAVTVTAAACRKPDPAQVKQSAVERGNALFDQAQYRQAVAAYQEALRVDPRDAELRVKLLDTYRRAEMWEQADAEVIRVADLRPDDVPAQLDAAETMVAQSKFVDAIDRITPVLQKESANMRAMVLLANAKARLVGPTWVVIKMEEALRLKNNVDAVRTNLRSRPPEIDDRDAERLYQQAMELASNDDAVFFGYAGLLFSMYRDDEALEVLRRAADSAPQHVFLNRALGEFYAMHDRPDDASFYLGVAAGTGDADSRLVFADFLLDHGRGAEALSFLMEMTDGAQAVEAMARIADIEAHRDDLVEAKTWTDKVLAQAPQHPTALRVKAYIAVMGKKAPASEAIASARKAVDAQPLLSEPHTLLGLALAAGGDNAAAFEEFAEALRRDPSSAIAMREMVHTAMALDRNDVALEFARQRVRDAAGDEAAQIDLVTVLTRLTQYAEADRLLRPLLARQPSSVPLLLQRGAIDAGTGKSTTARAAYERVLHIEPGSFDALSGLVRLDIGKGDLPSARKRTEQALANHPSDIRYLLLSSTVASAERDPARTEAILRKALALEPGNSEAALSLGRLLNSRQRFQDAHAVISAFLKQRPTSIDGQLLLGETLEALGRTADAQAVYERIIGVQPDAGQALFRLAAIHVEQDKNLDLALTLASNAKRQLPDDPAVNDTLGWVYARMGLPARGMPLLQEAVTGAPNNAAYRFHAGMTYIDVGKLLQARVELERALQLDAGFSGADKARAALAWLPKK